MGLSKTSAYGAALGVVLIWSMSWVITKGAQADCGPLLLGALSCLVGLLPALPWMWKQGWPGVRAFFLVGVIGSGGFMCLAQEAVAHAGAGKTTLLIYSMPFWAILLGWWGLRERPSVPQRVALGIAFLGLLLAVAPWQGASLMSGVLALGSGACWGVGTVATRHLLTQRPDYSPMALSGWQMLACVLLLGPAHLMSPELGVTWSPRLIFALGYSGLLCGAVAWMLWAFMVKRLPLVTTTLASLLVPVLGVLAAWVMQGERPAWNVVLGLLLVVASLPVSWLSARWTAPAPAPNLSLMPAE